MLDNFTRYVLPNIDLLLRGMSVTAYVCSFAFLLALAVGLIACLIRLYVPFVRVVAIGYIEFCRATPILVQLLWVNYVWPELFGFPRTVTAAGIAALALQSSGYLAETFRSGIEGLAQGQREAGLAVGMSNFQIMRRIVLPQVALVMAPSIVNQMTVVIKSSTLVSVIAVPDLMFEALKIVNRWFEPIEILTSTALLYVAALSASRQDVMAQLLETGIDPKSVLAKVKKGETLQVGYAQTPVWFYKDAKTGELRGIYKDLADMLAKDLEMRVNYVEVTFANATIGLRKCDFDLFGSSVVYTIPRALVCNYVGPLWSKGSLAIVHKDDAAKFKTISDLDGPEVTFSVNAGASEEQRMPLLFPKAKFIAVAGQQAMAAEPVRTRRATVYVTGDSDAIALTKRNAEWAHIIDEKHPFDKRPNTWMIRHGDEPWKNFLDMWSTYVTVNSEVQRLYDEYMAKLT